jgi:hypothetical protein
MINKHTGDIQFDDNLIVGPGFKLSTLKSSQDFRSWVPWSHNDERSATFQRELLDSAGKPLTVVLSFFVQKLDSLVISYPIADEPENPIGPIARQIAFHEQWLRDELGNCPYDCAWGWVGDGGCAPPGPAHGLIVQYH